ncbi:hypothetical protein PHMEG_00020622 [Phytophthora megakarya]|uniref:Uncharacterized protein n=1 Tax=Phytophthora megakarya TaxID=4795 RepID=A0A225VNW5_9STRA|nr:hypothetical protein PHMEG_00020622 [Phytophthora megakarya]
MDDAQQENGADKRRKIRPGAGHEASARFRLKRREEKSPKHKEDEDTESDEDDDDDAKESADKTLTTCGVSRGIIKESADKTLTSRVAANVATTGRHTKLTDLEQHVRSLERDNLHLKQALLLGKNAAGRNTATAASALSSLSSLAALRGAAGAPGENRANVQRMLAERTKVVTEMVEQLNAAYLSLGDASRVWHEDCRIGVGVREWDAFGRLQTISLWNMIRSVFTSIVVDIVELRPHLPDGEMILTKWRIQGEIASAQHLERVCASEDCPATMRVALMAIKSSDLTFTVTTYVVFQELRIAEQHHCWDQVGVFKRLFGGEIPSTVQDMLTIDEDVIAGRKQPLEV